MGMAATSDQPATRRFTADEVWHMVEIGLLGEDEPYELIDGELLYVSPASPPHVNVVADLTTKLVLAYGEGYRVRVGGPVAGIADSIPEPDLAVIPTALISDDRRAVSGEMLLVVEVSVTSARRDIRKGGIYAAAGVPEYWRIDVDGRVVHVHRRPRADGTWEEATEIGPDGMLPLPGITGAIAVADILRSRP